MRHHAPMVYRHFVTMTSISVTLLLLTVVGLTASAVLAFCWAGGQGHFHEMKQGAMSVFDVDEIKKGNFQPEVKFDDGTR